MKAKPDSETSRTHLIRRAAPLLAFLAASCLLVIFCYESAHTSLPPTEKRYVTAKASAASLKQDSKKGMLREPWEKLATEFRSIYEGDPSWPNRPAALFRAAESLEELARRSFARADARKAINSYETLALRHAQSRLADDALFRAAQMRAAYLKDDAGALTLLTRIKKQYPKGDMLPQALALEKAIRASARGKTAPDAVKAVAMSAPEPVEDISAKSRNTTRDFSGDIPLRFKAAKTRAANLAKDQLKSCWRQPWEQLREEFLAIHKGGKKNIAAQALFEAANCQKKLGECSRLSGDNKKAADLYLSVAKQYSGNELADNALLEAAKLQLKLPNGSQLAQGTLNRILAQYPNGDARTSARRLLADLIPKTAKAKQEANPELLVLSWDSPNKNMVEIVLEMSGPAKYATRVEKATGSSPARLIVDLDKANIVSDVRKGVTVNGSLLKAVRAQDTSRGASLQFDLRDIRQYNARTETDPARIILTVAAGKAALPADKKTTQTASKNLSPAKSRLVATKVHDMASQLGLTVHRVFIDAGHGGKDPGTSHNNIIERNITLDVALMLGALLEANGFEVVYSRTSNKYVGLSERTRMANAANADLFISIHVNANDQAGASGFETYYLDLATNAQAARVAMLENSTSDKRLGDMHNMLTEVMLHARANESRNLAADVQRLSLFRLKKRDYQVRNNGVKSAPFHVLLGAKMPAVLVELGYCSNSQEAGNLASSKYRHALAEGLAEGIMAYRDRLQHSRTASVASTRKK